jgi:Nickel responsive protein SCO4226-like
VETVARYVVERDLGQIGEEEIHELGVLSRQIAAEDFPEITWEHSHVCSDRSGAIKAFCIYSAPSEDRIRAHATSVGGHAIDNIYEIVGDVTPADFDPAPR